MLRLHRIAPGMLLAALLFAGPVAAEQPVAAQPAEEQSAAVEVGQPVADAKSDEADAENVAAEAVEDAAAENTDATAQKEETSAAEANSPQPAVSEPAAADEPATLTWYEEYLPAIFEARRNHKQLLIYFRKEGQHASQDSFENNTLVNQDIIEKLQDFVLVRLPVDATVTIKEEKITLLEHGAFADLHKRPGVAILDFTKREHAHWGHVVSVYPFKSGRYLSPEHLAIMVDLPPGTLTQRTLIFAVRIHPEAPQSTTGATHTVLMTAATNHSVHQASITLQGHHNWESRFHSINAKLNNGMTATEVCAESWPGEDLVDAAVECVHSWRQSSGHWRAVRSRHPLFGYDMKRGRNGIWYATGIFGRRH